MLDISGVCNLYAYLYTNLIIPPGTFDHVVPVDGCYAAVAYREDADYVLFRGSVTLVDWAADFWQPQFPYHDAQLGPVHPGFLIGVNTVQSRIDALVGHDGRPVVVVGHSLGAGHAQIYAGRRLANKQPVDRLLLFGSPRAGMSELGGVLTGTKIWSYRNTDADGHDLITDVPLKLGPLLDYRHPVALTDISQPPPPDDRWGLFRYHHFALYCEALKASGAAATSLQV